MPMAWVAILKFRFSSYRGLPNVGSGKKGNILIELGAPLNNFSPHFTISVNNAQEISIRIHAKENAECSMRLVESVKMRTVMPFRGIPFIFIISRFWYLHVPTRLGG